MGVQELFNIYLKQDKSYLGAGNCFYDDEDIEHCDIDHQDYYTDRI